MHTKVSTDILIIGAGAAGLTTAIWAGRTHPNKRITILDGAKKLGAKILVAGGGRCNVTHDVVDVSAYAGGSRNAIKKVLRRFDVPQTIQFFDELGVQMKREETGKLFPTTNKARTVLNALLNGARMAGCTIDHPKRVETITKESNKFCVRGTWGEISAEHVVLATGGRSLPKSGSDGHGYTLAQSLGHTITEQITPALVPLTLPIKHWLCELSGITLSAKFTLSQQNGKRLISYSDSTLCTHFGLSGPAVLDISRHYLAQSDLVLTVNWLPEITSDMLDRALQDGGRRTPSTILRDYLPQRMVRSLIAQANIDLTTPCDQLRREQRKTLVKLCTACPLPITGDRGWNYAEVTAGGIPLTEINVKTMESRVCPGLYLVGEICDVDGRIGGYNFQWAWSSGYVAGISC